MKNTIYLFVFFLSSLLQCHSQSDTAGVLATLEAKLRAGTNVSTILTDINYISIHPDSRFRDLIKNHAPDGTVSIAPVAEPGDRIKVNGLVTDDKNQPIAKALVYLYQTDSRGWYAADAPHVLSNEGDTRHARLFGYVKTDANGKFVLETVKPSGYPNSDLPAHIHVHVWATGYSNYVTEFLFDDDPRLKGDIRQRAVEQQHLLLSKPTPATPPFKQTFSYTLRLLRNS